MKYRDAVAWLAINDGDSRVVADVAARTGTRLIASLWRRPALLVAQAVVAFRATYSDNLRKRE